MTLKEKMILLSYALGLICIIAAILTEGLAAVYLSVVGFIVSFNAMRAAARLANSEGDGEDGERKEM